MSKQTPEHRFIGDSHAPAPLVSVQRRRPVLGSGKIPAEIQAMMRSRSLYLETESSKKPQIDIDAVESQGQKLWKVQVPVSERLKGARPGLTLERHPAEKFLREVDQSVSFKSHRPDWVDALPQPRLTLARLPRQ